MVLVQEDTQRDLENILIQMVEKVVNIQKNMREKILRGMTSTVST